MMKFNHLVCFCGVVLLTLTKTYEVITTLEDLLRVCGELNHYKQSVKNPRFALDLETYFSDLKYKLDKDTIPEPIKTADGSWEGLIRFLSIGLDPTIIDKQYLIDVKALTLEGIRRSPLPEILRTTNLLGHNLKYDIAFLIEQLGITTFKNLRDTMLIAQVQQAGDKCSNALGSLYSRYINGGLFKELTGRFFDDYAEFKKNSQSSDWSNKLTIQQLEYAADDIKLIFYLYKSQEEDLDIFIKKYKCPGIVDVIKLECGLIPVYAFMELRGVGLDRDYVTNTMMPYLLQKKEEAEREVFKYFKREVEICDWEIKINKKGEEYRRRINIRTEIQVINIGSTPQLKKALLSIGIPLPDEKSTEANTLILFVNDHPVMPWILQYKKAAGILSKFGQKNLDAVRGDGRIHPSWFQIGAGEDGGITTGRSSCKAINMQQQPSRGLLFDDVPAGKFCRSQFIPAKGNVLVGADFSQIEPRVTADFTGDPVLTEELMKPEADLHALTAKALLGLSYLPQRGTFERDYIGKTANLALTYRMGYRNLTKFMFLHSEGKIDWTEEEAKEKVNKYDETFAGVKSKSQEVFKKVKKSLEPFDSLSYFAGRKIIFLAVTGMGRPRRWCLTELQEKAAREYPHMLDRYYEGEYSYNNYKKTMGQIAREAFNHYIQGEAANIQKLGLLKCYKRFQQENLTNIEDCCIIAVVHDEILIECKEHLAERVTKILKESMIEAGEQLIKKVPIAVETYRAKNWGSAK